VVVFLSAALVFTVEPMMARLVLPILGGSAAVWNTSLVFFQGVLLAGYLYAHALQRVSSLRAQVAIHAGVLVLAAFLSLPLALSPLQPEPGRTPPALWLIEMLTLSVGAPFFALSATAPLLQAWRARTGTDEEGGGPWSLYGASNLGSLLALLAYPVLIEPNLGLAGQRGVWSVGFLIFGALVFGLAVVLWRQVAAARAAPSSPTRVTWLDRGRWIALAAIPSSLLLGVTTYVATDIGSAPFLWVAPLALYLLTFVLAFQAKTPRWSGAALIAQAITIMAACALARPIPIAFVPAVAVHFVNFFLTALICHLALVARRPDASRLTEFYLCLSIGGVIGGAFNAFVAPVVFSSNIEYPAVLALSCLARPWSLGKRLAAWPAAMVALCGLFTLVAVAIIHPPHALESLIVPFGLTFRRVAVIVAILIVADLAFAVRNRAPYFFACTLLLLWGGSVFIGQPQLIRQWRGFYGLLREARAVQPALGGEIHRLTNGSTLHGAEAVAPAFRCRPLLYYAHETPIGQVVDAEQRIKPALDVGVVGLGAGTMATYDRAADHFTFFEIDPLVLKVASDPRNFAYVSKCAKGRLDFVLGDARLTLGHRTNGPFDVLLIDAFSSDSVPAHLLTVQAARLYLSRIKPDGVVILHLSNRNLDLIAPALAVARAAGGFALLQTHHLNPNLPSFWESSEDAVIIARNPAALAPFAADPRWRAAGSRGVAPWTDDHIDLFGAFVRHLSGQDRDLGVG
jgi:hypothetical protein